MIWSFTSTWWGARQPQKEEMAWRNPTDRDEAISLQEFDIDDSRCPLLYQASSENSRHFLSIYLMKVIFISVCLSKIGKYLAELATFMMFVSKIRIRGLKIKKEYGKIRTKLVFPTYMRN